MFPGPPLGLDPGEQGLGRIVAADQVGVPFAPCGGELAAEGLGEDGLGEVIDPALGVLDTLFYFVGEGEELVDAADDFGLFFK